ncbi:30S ribosomal protein S6 [Terrihabitans rhizophilus]|uniref:Small ribosomal subunit protein bS6 n=1 Tax=Terrihabitans rhizophilus TaxID=3092662 RepID=A0ABU4RK81_9HYPH|nr:30S ribosomal protein S6 [Terrihabitans sp. PJ23]MDX6805249.1 30S ribosomal protein S6 [Terrihabitans sp. PJ23]
MPLYEHVFLTRQDLTTQQVEELVEQYKTVITDNGGEVGKTEYWGVKSLAFRIAKNRKAHYSLMNITAPPAAVAELERLQKINEDVLRVLTIRVEEHETEPSAVMQRRDRDERERSERGDRPPRREFDDRPPRREERTEAVAAAEVEGEDA